MNVPNPQGREKELARVYTPNDGFIYCCTEETDQGLRFIMRYDECTLYLLPCPFSSISGRQFDTVSKRTASNSSAANAIPNKNEVIPHAVVMALRYAYCAEHVVFLSIDLKPPEAYVKIDGYLYLVTIDEKEKPAKISLEELRALREELKDAAEELRSAIDGC